METPGQINFTFTWRALELLGKGLYSNPWSAISELVANGFDAKATEVLVYIDLRDRKDATIEIIDNGHGMDPSDVEIYTRVGHNKRADAPKIAGQNTDVMGRKGIGKLAALYLSSLVTISTRTIDSESIWMLDARPNMRGDLDDFPHLTEGDREPGGPCRRVWGDFVTGTRIHLSGVDLTRMGERTVAGLKQLLANQFISGETARRVIKVWVQTEDLKEGESAQAKFGVAEKAIAFKNLVGIEHNFTEAHPDPEELASADFRVTFPPREAGKKPHVHQVSTKRFDAKVQEDMLWPGYDQEIDLTAGTYLGRPFELSGWVGIHSTIRTNEAEKNDPRFLRNGTYNPAQIRLYVRGKLASDRLLSQLGLTRQYLNYVEGELSFDLLDDDSLADIATASRQDFDETDNRVALLRALVRPVVQRLISARQSLVAKQEKDDRTAEEEEASRAKSVFSDQIERDLKNVESLSEAERDEIQRLALNKLQGQVLAKREFTIFFSHSSRDSAFATFLYELLRSRGVRPDEVFYTSKPNDASGYAVLEALQVQIKNMIRAKNTLLFYFTSDNFLSSQYCMFEGGAGWITRSVGEYALLSTRFRDVPEFLTNGKREISLISNGSIELRPDVYQYLISLVLNPMINHLNDGRKILGQPLIETFKEIEFPTKVELNKSGRSESDFYDRDVVDYWDAHVSPIVVDYLAALKDRDGKRGT